METLSADHGEPARHTVIHRLSAGESLVKSVQSVTVDAGEQLNGLGVTDTLGHKTAAQTTSAVSGRPGMSKTRRVDR